MVKPRRMNRKASVTMKLGRPVLTTMIPFTAPMAMHRAKVSRMAIQIGQPMVTPISAMDMPAKPIIEPTDRSNSPATINMQAPTAMIMNCALTRLQFMMPCALNMPLSPAKMRKKVKTAMVPTIPPSSGRISQRRTPPIALTLSSSLSFCGPVADCIWSVIALLVPRQTSPGKVVLEKWGGQHVRYPPQNLPGR